MLDDFVEILGVICDERLNLEKRINRVACRCYVNLRNLGRIASKLTKTLKVQCRDRWYLARVQSLISRIANVGWN